MNLLKNQDIANVFDILEENENEMMKEYIITLEKAGNFELAQKLKKAINIDYDAASTHLVSNVLLQEGVVCESPSKFEKIYNEREYIKMFK